MATQRKYSQQPQSVAGQKLRRCSTCGEIKLPGDFYANQGRCKPCFLEYCKERRQKNFLKNFTMLATEGTYGRAALTTTEKFARIYREFYERRKICPECGKLYFSWIANNIRCNACTTRMYNSRKRTVDYNRNKHNRRKARQRNNDYESFAFAEIFERDGWMCGICGEPVDKNLLYPHLKCATLDHIVPVSMCGGHTRTNVQLAHFDCNFHKGATVLPVMRGPQLSLI